VPGYDSTQWFGVLAPAGAPREIVMQLHSGIVRALQQPDLKGRLLSDGAEPVGSSPEEFARYIRSETAKWAKVVKDAGIPVD
jgi:tripartite-type tricarboxylate transporter receptor subunit TctC